MDVRRRLPRCAPVPSALPMSCASERMYVPDVHETRKRATAPSSPRISSDRTVTAFGVSGTASPARASS